MITPKEIETKAFSRAKTGGYKPEEVDSFLDEILVSYTKLLEEKDVLARKVASLTEKLESTREEQDQWKNTIISTQKNYNDVIASANKKADKLVYEAQDYAKKLIQSAQEEAENQKRIKEALATEVEDFKTKLLSIYQSHVKLISSIPVIKQDTVEEDSSALEVLKVATADMEEIAPEAEDKDVSEKMIDSVPEADVVESNDEFPKEDVKEEEKEEDLSATRTIEPTRARRFIPETEDEEDVEEDEEEIKPVRKPVKTASVKIVEDDDDDDEEEDDDKVGGLFDQKKSKSSEKKKFGLFGRKKKDDDDDDYDDDDDDDDEDDDE